MRIISGIGAQLANKERADLIGAVVAGLCAGAARSGLNALNRDPSLWAVTRWTIIAVAAYLAVAKLLQLFSWDVLDRILPRWLLTAFFGSIAYVAALLGPSVIDGWYDPHRADSSLIEYVLTKLCDAKAAIVLLSLLSLPVLGAFHYFEQIRTAVKAWHAGSPPPNIIN